MTAEGIKRALTAFGGDTEGVEERFAGDMELYASCLVMLCEDKGFAAMADALAKNDAAAAFAAAHALKGVTANLGLTPLYKTLSALVEALRDRTVCDGAALAADCARTFALRDEIAGWLDA